MTNHLILLAPNLPQLSAVTPESPSPRGCFFSGTVPVMRKATDTFCLVTWTEDVTTEIFDHAYSSGPVLRPWQLMKKASICSLWGSMSFLEFLWDFPRLYSPTLNQSQLQAGKQRLLGLSIHKSSGWWICEMVLDYQTWFRMSKWAVLIQYTLDMMTDAVGLNEQSLVEAWVQ